MNDSSPLQVSLFTYSTKPRGGVVHSLQLAEALQALGHRPRLYALGREDEESFFRPVTPPTTIVPFRKREEEPFSKRVQRYIGRFHEYLLEEGPEPADIYHSQDCISANALWRLRDEGRIPHVIRTVHHVDDFKTESLVRCQNNSILRPDRRIVVSRYWKERLREQYEVESTVIPNGVDVRRFTPPDGEAEKNRLKRELDVENRHLLLSIGGVEPRKNTLRTLEAFERIQRRFDGDPTPVTWIIAGGKTLFDYRSYRDDFYQRLEESRLREGEDVRILGTVSDETIRNLYRAADGLLFASVKEGFGLVALEAMASGCPVVASDLEVFREFLAHEENALLVDPEDPTSIAGGAERLIEDEQLRKRLVERGLVTAQKYGWDNTARRHEDFYRELA